MVFYSIKHDLRDKAPHTYEGSWLDLWYPIIFNHRKSLMSLKRERISNQTRNSDTSPSDIQTQPSNSSEFSYVAKMKNHRPWMRNGWWNLWWCIWRKIASRNGSPISDGLCRCRTLISTKPDATCPIITCECAFESE